MIDQCHSEIGIVNNIMTYIIVINFKYFMIKISRGPGVFVTLWALALVKICFTIKSSFLYARLKNGTYYVTGYGVRQ